MEDETGKAIDSEGGVEFVAEVVDRTGLRKVPGGAPMLRMLLHMLSGNETRMLAAAVDMVRESAPAAVKAVKKRRRRKRSSRQQVKP